MNKHIQIALDGPSGAGKSTLAKAIARELGIIYIDTGAMYRTIALYMYRNGVDAGNPAAVVEQLDRVKVSIRYIDGEQRVFLGDEDVSTAIRENIISLYASKVSAIPEVRASLLSLQRTMAEENSVIMDGRDIGTVILPNADVKFYLNADPEIRAHRRFLELTQKGQQVNEADILREIKERDYRDEHREVAPAVAAADTIRLNGNGELADILADALAIIRERIGN